MFCISRVEFTNVEFTMQGFIADWWFVVVVVIIYVNVVTIMDCADFTNFENIEEISIKWKIIHKP